MCNIIRNWFDKYSKCGLDGGLWLKTGGGVWKGILTLGVLSRGLPNFSLVGGDGFLILLFWDSIFGWGVVDLGVKVGGKDLVVGWGVMGWKEGNGKDWGTGELDNPAKRSEGDAFGVDGGLFPVVGLVGTSIGGDKVNCFSCTAFETLFASFSRLSRFDRSSKIPTPWLFWEVLLVLNSC